MQWTVEFRKKSSSENSHQHGIQLRVDPVDTPYENWQAESHIELHIVNNSDSDLTLDTHQAQLGKGLYVFVYDPKHQNDPEQIETLPPHPQFTYWGDVAEDKNKVKIAPGDSWSTQTGWLPLATFLINDARDFGKFRVKALLKSEKVLSVDSDANDNVHMNKCERLWSESAALDIRSK